MKKIGIVGGVGWLSTVEYYAGLCRRSEARHLVSGLPGVPTMPEVCIESLDLSKAVSYIGKDEDEGSWTRFDEYHRAAVQRLAASGADFALMASNTPHHRFGEIVRGVSIPVISMLDAIAGECARIGARQVLLLGTSVTMSSAKFRAAFAQRGVEASGPIDDDPRCAAIRLIADLQSGKHEGSAERIATIARASIARQFSAQSVVCLACTELPLAFPEFKDLSSFVADGVTYVNSSASHVDAAFEFATARGG